MYRARTRRALHALRVVRLVCDELVADVGLDGPGSDQLRSPPFHPESAEQRVIFICIGVLTTSCGQRRPRLTLYVKAMLAENERDRLIVESVSFRMMVARVNRTWSELLLWDPAVIAHKLAMPRPARDRTRGGIGDLSGPVNSSDLYDLSGVDGVSRGYDSKKGAAQLCRRSKAVGVALECARAAVRVNFKPANRRKLRSVTLLTARFGPVLPSERSH